MIGEALAFLRRYLDDRLRSELGGAPDDPVAERVVFVDGDRMDPLALKPGAVTLLLVNVAEERIHRNADPYLRRTDDGRFLRVAPDLRLTLHLLCIARFKDYRSAWSHLSKIVEHLASVRVLDAESAPGIPSGIEKLAFELLTIDLDTLNQIWGALRAAHHPSILYRVNLLALPDRRGVELPETGGVERSLRRKE